jgi:hypothetical protein
MSERRTGAVAAAIALGIAAIVGIWALSGGGGGGSAERAEGAESGVGTDGPMRTRGSSEVGDGGALTPAPTGASPDPAGEPPPRAPAAEASRTVVRAGWGGGRGELGRNLPMEANAEAPMSITTAPDGTVLVLDQVNGRIARFAADGTPLDPIALGVDEPQDLAVGADGTMVVLDRLVSRRVAILGPDGREVGSLPLEGEGVPEPAGVTGVFLDGDDVYVERENGPLVRIGDRQGSEREREEIPGRPSRDGQSYLMTGLIEPQAGRFYVNSIARPSREHRFTRDIAVPLALRQILLLDTDRSGVIYVAVAGWPYGAPEGAEEVRLMCLSPLDGTTVGFAVLPGNAGPEETLRELTVLDGGGVLYAVRTEAGVEIGLYDCRG